MAIFGLVLNSSKDLLTNFMSIYLKTQWNIFDTKTCKPLFTHRKFTGGTRLGLISEIDDDIGINKTLWMPIHNKCSISIKMLDINKHVFKWLVWHHQEEKKQNPNLTNTINHQIFIAKIITVIMTFYLLLIVKKKSLFSMKL